MTDNLIKEAQEINSNINKRELDVLLTVGEQITISKLSMCLNKLGYNSISLTGWQVPIKTDGIYGNSNIIKINLNKIIEELDKNNIVIVAGFQGVDENTNDITTLGRGGSDTTAVAIAAAIKANRCEIYKDVDGVYNSDPKVNKDAFKYDIIDYDKMLALSNNGAKVLHNKSVELAKKYNVCVHVKSLYNNDSTGTIIKKTSKTIDL